MGFVEWGFLAALSPGCLASLLTWPLSDSLGQDFPRWLSASVDSAPVEVWPVGWEVPWTHLTSQEDMFDQLGRGQKTRDSIVTIGSKLIVQSAGDQKFVKTLRFPSVKLPKSDHHWLRGHRRVPWTCAREGVAELQQWKALTSCWPGEGLPVCCAVIDAQSEVGQPARNRRPSSI